MSTGTEKTDRKNGEAIQRFQMKRKKENSGGKSMLVFVASVELKSIEPQFRSQWSRIPF